MTLKSIILASFLILLSTIPAFCEYYQYIDKNGVKHFTDNLTEIPEHQKKELNIYQTIDTPDNKKPRQIKTTPNENTITAESLVIKKDALDIEYESLMKRKQELNEKKEQIGKKKYNEMVIKLNEEIKQYQDKSQAYEKLLIQYNDQITPDQSTPPAPWKDIQEQTE